MKDQSIKEATLEAYNERIQFQSTILANVQESIIVTDRKGNITYWNKGAEKLFGYTEKEMIGKTPSMIYPAQQQKSLQVDLKKVVGDNVYDGYWQGKHKNGNSLWIKVHTTIMRNSEGKEVGFIGVSKDVTEEKWFQEQLQMSEERFRNLIESANIIPWESDIASGNFTYVGPQAEKILKYPIKTWYKSGFWEKNIHPEDKEWVIHYCTSSAKEKHNYEFEYRMISQDKRVVWLQDIVTVIKKNDKPVLLRGFMIDITEKKQIEEKLRRSEDRYKAFIEKSTEAIWRFELEKPMSIHLPIRKQINHFYKYAYLAECNSTIAKMYGYSKPEDLIGARLGDMLIRSDKNNIEYLTGFVTSGYDLSHAESHEKDKEGKNKYFLNSLIGIIENDHLVRAWGTQQDITERKRIEDENEFLYAEVKRERERINHLLSNVPGVVWEAYGRPDAAKQRIDFISDYVEKMLGYSVKEWLQTPNFWLKVVHPDDKERAASEAAAIFISKKGGTSRFRWVAKNGRIYWVEAQSFVIKDKRGNPIGMRGVTMDISDRVDIEKRKDEFISMASHELKTPITSIKVFLQLLQRNAKNDTNKQFLRYITRMDEQIDRLTDLVGDLLDVSKIQTGKLALLKQDFSLHNLLQDTVENIQETSQNHKIIIRNTVHGKVFGDKNRIQQVIINMLTNAIKYSPDHDKIIVSAKKNSHGVIVGIKDYGVGIDKEHQDKIFERFYRVYDSTDKTFPGLGMGLYISSEIIKRHGGKMWVKSEKGKGSMFYFLLPEKDKS